MLSWKEAKLLEIQGSLFVDIAVWMLGIGGRDLWMLMAIGRRHERSQPVLERSGVHSAKCI